ncbi:hypothetical protein CTEN210_16174 [Chaetoceros tenuissimus]|uniref:J domain-containing protein n=1 Tax=Chaetoceros tenuissimus TaxID=426638 RepID=A0AAD3D8J6_9STRA|nr:hypothetical protein CTEN210_16174 [Chaetoceros tenuissimus]
MDSINLKQVLRTACTSSPANPSILQQEIQDNYDFGEYADEIFYKQLTDAILSCKSRYMGRNLDNGSDDDEETESCRMSSTPHQFPQTYREQNQEEEDDDDQYEFCGDQGDPHGLDESFETFHTVQNDFGGLNFGKKQDTESSVDPKLQYSFENMFQEDVAKSTPLKSKKEANFEQDVGSPCSFYSTREYPTVDRKIEKQPRQTQQEEEEDDQGTEQEQASQQEQELPPAPDTDSDDDLFSPLPTGNPASNTVPESDAKMSSTTKTPLVRNRVSSPPTIPRENAQKVHANQGKNLFGTSNSSGVGLDDASLQSDNAVNTSSGSGATVKTGFVQRDPEEKIKKAKSNATFTFGGKIPSPPREAPPPMEQDSKIFGSTVNMDATNPFASSAGTNLPNQTFTPATSTTINTSTASVSSAVAASIPSVPNLKLNLNLGASNSSKPKPFKTRGSPRNKTNRKKPFAFKPIVPPINTAATATNVLQPTVKTPKDVEMEEMEVDTPFAPGAANDTTQPTTTSDMSVPQFSMGIGDGGSKTPSRKSSRFKNNKARGATIPSSPSTIHSSSTANSNPSTFTFAQSVPPTINLEETARMKLMNEVDEIRKEAKGWYTMGNYKESVKNYTNAISHLTQRFTSFPKPLKDEEKSEVLASLYGNRAAALIMLGAYQPAAKDCESALNYLKEFNPVALDYNNRDMILSCLKADGGLTYRAKLLARQGRALMKCGEVDEAKKTVDTAERVAKVALECHDKIVKHAARTGIAIPLNTQRQSENVLKNCLTDAALIRTEVTRVGESVAYIQKNGGIRRNVDSNLSQRNNAHMLPYVTTILNSCPTDEKMLENKVICLASMKKWREVIKFCETLACKNAQYDGVFNEDLEPLNPHRGVSAATRLTHTDVSRSIENGDRCMNIAEVREAVLRLPLKVAKYYTRALRLEESYDQLNAALLALKGHSKDNEPIYSPTRKAHWAAYQWVIREIEKFKITQEKKAKGDSYFHQQRYEEATKMYGEVLTVDMEDKIVYGNLSDIETMGGRLHAVLFCNRAACLIQLKRYDEALKECSAALKIEKGYMKAILRRARCYFRLKRYEESIAEYNKWIFAVEECRRNSGVGRPDECPFDRASNISDSEYRSALNDRGLVMQQKKEAAQQAARQKEEERRKREAQFNRQQNFNSRSWDPFNGSGPRRSNNESNYGHSRQNYRDTYNSSSRYSNGNKSSSSSRNTYHHQKNEKKPSASPSSNAVSCHYDVLQLKSSANQTEIKKAYRKMALKYHPDKNGNCEKAADTFRKIQQAYETLSDENEKRKYDIERRRSRGYY